MDIDKRKLRTNRPGVCQLCSHPDRVRIETLRIGGASSRALARQFNVHKDAILRHCRDHVSPKRRAELVAGPEAIEGLAYAAAAESRSLLESPEGCCSANF
jgi:hypothetical protein